MMKRVCWRTEETLTKRLAHSILILHQHSPDGTMLRTMIAPGPARPHTAFLLNHRAQGFSLGAQERRGDHPPMAGGRESCLRVSCAVRPCKTGKSRDTLPLFLRLLARDEAHTLRDQIKRIAHLEPANLSQWCIHIITLILEKRTF